MKKNIVILLLLLLAVLLVMQGCTTTGNDTAATVPAATDNSVQQDAAANDAAMAKEPEGLKLTLDELAQYDGADGNPAYIAVDGVIYEVSDSSAWPDGSHNGFSAGQDLTEEIKTISPHGVSKLNNLTVVGTLVDKKE